MRILADLAATVEEWSRLKKYLTGEDPEISASAAGLALEIAGPEDKSAAIDILIAKVPYVNGCVQKEIDNCLAKHYDIAMRQRRLQNNIQIRWKEDHIFRDKPRTTFWR